jgi:hypothetical protein
MRVQTWDVRIRNGGVLLISRRRTGYQPLLLRQLPSLGRAQNKNAAISRRRGGMHVIVDKRFVPFAR